MAIQEANKRKILKQNPNIKDEPGIYFLTRISEEQLSEAYIGQAGGLRKENGKEVKVKQGVLTRLAQHTSGYPKQHIDASLKAHGFYSEDNPYGYKVDALYFEPELLNEKEQFYIAKYLEEGWILKNKTSGSQSYGKEKIAEYQPRKGYRDGKEAGYVKASKDVYNLFDKHLAAIPKKDPPTKLQERALEKFNEFLNYHKKETI